MSATPGSKPRFIFLHGTQVKSLVVTHESGVHATDGGGGKEDDSWP